MGIRTIVNLHLCSICVISAIIAGVLTEVELDLTLQNSSPAVLDSNITFKAELDITPHGDSAIQLYKYVWTDSTSPGRNATTYGNGTSKLQRLYGVHSMEEYKPGTYTMKVQVFKKINSSLTAWVGNENPLAKGTMSFNLTDSLNVSASLNQSLTTISPEGVFATDQIIQVASGVHEAFDSVEYTYEVYTNGSLNYSGLLPYAALRYNQTGRTNVSVRIIANITVHEPQWPAEISVREGWRNLTIQLKESVNHVTYLGESDYLAGEQMSASFVCAGSPPFLFAFGMSGNIQPQKGLLTLSRREDVSHDKNMITGMALRRSDWKPVCLARFQHVFNETGSFTLYLRVQNDVGVQETQVPLLVVYPDERMQPAVIAMCVVIAISSFLIIAVVYFRERGTIVQTPNEETADHYFYFSPGEGTSDTPSSPTIRQFTRPRRIKQGLGVMYSTAKNWVVSVASSHGSQTSSAFSYDEL